MKKSIAIALLPALLTLCAHAEYYTANEDIYYHWKNGCTAGSSYIISEESAWQFRKVACPICVNRQANEGETVVLPLPELFNLYSADMDAQGNLLFGGYAGTPSDRSAYIGLFSIDGEKIWQQNERKDIFFRDANVLSDGSIAALFPMDKSKHSGWEIRSFSGDENSLQLSQLRDASCFEPVDDGILIVNRASTEETQLIKYDNNGNELWNAALDGFHHLHLLSGEGVHLAYGTRAVDAKDYQGDHRAHALFFDDNGTILCQISDDDYRGFEGFQCAAWCADGGAVLCGLNDRPGFILKYNQKGEEIWQRSLEYICGEDAVIQINGSSVRCLEIMDILPWEDGHLLAISTNAGFARMIQIDSEGYIKRDWIEAIDGAASTERLKMFERNGDVYLLAHCMTLLEPDGENGMQTMADIPRKTICKKLDIRTE